MSVYGYLGLEKTTDALEGGAQRATNQLTMNFATKSYIQLELEGNFGFVGATGDNDILGWRVTEGEKILMQGLADPSVDGLNKQVFSETFVLKPGKYAFTIGSKMQETVRLAEKREAGFQLNKFQISSAVPEPSSSWMALLLLSSVSLRRTRRRA